MIFLVTCFFFLQHHINEKGCKESDRSSNISDLKVDIRSGSCEPDYSETCSRTDSIATKLAANILGSTPQTTIGTGGSGGGVPLAGPVKIPGDYRYFYNINHNILASN